jgi:hypothetical protein
MTKTQDRTISEEEILALVKKRASSPKISWHDLNTILILRTEAQVKALLDEEVEIHKRPTYAVRIHQRYTTLRAVRERKEILAALSGDKT